MKSSLRLAAVLTAAVLTAGSLAACHGSKGLDPFEIPESFDGSRTYEITFWAKNDTNKNQTEIYSKAIRDFEALYPNIKVSIRLYTDYNRIYNDVITNISTDTTPNVCITYPDHIATYLTGSNVVVPLDGLFADARYGFGGSELKYDSVAFDEMIPEFLDECRFDGSYYAVPYMRSTEACYVNRTYVEKLGYELPETLTWDFVWEVSDAAAAKAEDGTYLVNGQKVMIPFIYKSSDNMLITVLRQKNAGYSTDAGEIRVFNDTTKELLQTIAAHTGTGAFSTFKVSGYPANFLNAGQCIFAIDSTAGSTWMGSDAPLVDIAEDKIVRFETEVLPVPQFDTEHPQMISQGPSVCVFNKSDPQEVMASWLFAQYLLTNDVQIAYAETEGYVPVTYKAQKAPEYRDYLSRGGEDTNVHYDVKIRATQLLIDNTANTFVTPVFNGSTSLRSAASQLVENTVKSVRRKEPTGGSYYEDMFDDVTALYRLDQINTAAVSEKQDLGRLPTSAAVLLAGLGGVWLLIGVYYLTGLIRKRKKSR